MRLLCERPCNHYPNDSSGAEECFQTQISYPSLSSWSDRDGLSARYFAAHPYCGLDLNPISFLSGLLFRVARDSFQRSSCFNIPFEKRPFVTLKPVNFKLLSLRSCLRVRFIVTPFMVVALGYIVHTFVLRHYYCTTMLLLVSWCN